MMKSTTPDKRFLNFPLIMLTKTITEPEKGLHEIICYAIGNYAEKCRPDDPAEALVQAMYVASQRPSEHLPDAVRDILAREDVDSVVEALPENFVGADGSGADFIAGCHEMIEDADIQLDSHEAENLIGWLSWRRAAEYFNRTINNYSGCQNQHDQAAVEIAEHEAQFPPLVWCSVPADYAFEVMEHGRGLDLFRCVAACRSIIGRHRFTGTTKTMIRYRMIGAKSKAAASELLQVEAIRKEYDRLSTRYQFDKTLDSIDRERRGFITKIGVARRIWLSTKARSHKELAGWINEHRHRNNKAAEAEARKLLS
jgi:hypothetical protein